MLLFLYCTVWDSSLRLWLHVGMTYAEVKIHLYFNLLSIPRVMAFFALTLLVSENCMKLERFVKSLSATALKCSSLLTNFSFHATQKTKGQKKRFCAKISQNPFVYCFLLSSCLSSPRAPGFGVCVTPKVFSFFFDSKKEPHFYSSSFSMSGVSSPSSIETFRNFFAMICVRFDAPSIVSVASSSFF